MTLREIIADEIRRTGPVPFSHYMELCLYHAELGYYARRTEQFGKAGDFYTSSDVHAVFGRLLSRQFAQMWRALGEPEAIEILELGPGRGLFAQDVLDWSHKKFPAFFDALRYSLVERSPALRERLQSTLREHFEAGKARFADIQDGARGSSSAPRIVFANEFFDALPVEILSARGKLYVALQGDRLAEIWQPPRPAEVEFLDRYGVHPEGSERIEVPIIAQEMAAKIAADVASGFAIIVDYGYTRQEQLAGRHRGTLMTYRQHSAGANPYEAPGEQDITAHVNFTALSAAIEGEGMQLQSLLTQSQFLMGIGEADQFADIFAEARLPQERTKLALQIKHLVTPAGVGENFHVLVASRNVNPEQVRSLSGLSFARSRL